MVAILFILPNILRIYAFFSRELTKQTLLPFISLYSFSICPSGHIWGGCPRFRASCTSSLQGRWSIWQVTPEHSSPDGLSISGFWISHGHHTTQKPQLEIPSITIGGKYLMGYLEFCGNLTPVLDGIANLIYNFGSFLMFQHVVIACSE